MPGSRFKSGNGKNTSKRRQTALGIGDVSVKDFADCALPQACGRLKKSLSSSNRSEIKTKIMSAEAHAKKIEEELSWFEKDLEDFVIREEPKEGTEEDWSDQAGAPLMIKGKKQSKEKSDQGGRSYPDDLWHLLSEYISPEDIGRFACICHGTNQVVQMASFWRKMYYRIYHEKPNLPAQVMPARMERIHGLRTRVIRSLFVLYPPFASRFQGKGPMDDEPHDLRGQRCLVMWHQPAAKGWQFCFKFQKPNFALLSSRLVSKMDVYHGFNDLHYNPEEGCSVLQVTCCHFSSDAAVMGLLLTQVYVTLSQGFRHHRLRLHFDTRITNSHNSPCDNIVVLDDVVAIKIFKWWHPSYPFIH